MEKQRNPTMQKLNTIIVYFFALSSVFPPIQAFNRYNLSCFIAMMLWIICVLISNPKFFIHGQLHIKVLMFFMIYTFFLAYILGNGVIGNRYLAYGQTLIFYLIYQYNHFYGYDNSSRTIIMWIFPFMIITSVITLTRLMENPYLSRIMTNSEDLTKELHRQCVGGYEFVFFLAMITVILMFIIFNKKQLKLTSKSWLAFLMLLLLFVFTVIFSNYFTAFIIILVSFFILIITKKRNSNRVLVVTALGILLIIQIKHILVSLTNFLINILGSGKTVDRIITFQSNLLGNGSGESLLTERMWTFQTSIDAFIHNPLFGVVAKPIEFSGSYLVGFGQHSQILDTFSLYGLFIGLLNIYIIVQPFIKRMKLNKILLSLPRHRFGV